MSNKNLKIMIQHGINITIKPTNSRNLFIVRDLTIILFVKNHSGKFFSVSQTISEIQHIHQNIYYWTNLTSLQLKGYISNQDDFMFA